MKKEDIIKFENLKASGSDIRVYYAFLHLKEEKQRYPKLNEIIDFMGNTTKYYKRTVQRSLKFLRENDLIPSNPHSIVSEEHQGKKCGVYSIKASTGIYVGQSRNIDLRWKEHRRNAKLQIHRYFSPEDNLEFSILEECDKGHLITKELLWANKLHYEGENILNKENFMFVEEE